MSVAALPMYDLAELRASHERLWQAVRSALAADDGYPGPARDALPLQLSRTEDLWSLWTDPDLVLAQTCGHPYACRLRGSVALVGTPDYGVVQEHPGWYCSRIVVRADDERASIGAFKDSIFAYNDLDSLSGLHAMAHALLLTVGERRHFASCLKTGGHAASIEAVASGRADIAAIDAVTWRLLSNSQPAPRLLRVLCDTEPLPGLPYIAALGTPPESLANAVESAIDALADHDRSQLGLVGFWRSVPDDYTVIAERAQASAGVLEAQGLIAQGLAPRIC